MGERIMKKNLGSLSKDYAGTNMKNMNTRKGSVDEDSWNGRSGPSKKTQIDVPVGSLNKEISINDLSPKNVKFREKVV